jgi:hypothetical protein
MAALRSKSPSWALTASALRMPVSVTRQTITRLQAIGLVHRPGTGIAVAVAVLGTAVSDGQQRLAALSSRWLSDELSTRSSVGKVVIGGAGSSSVRWPSRYGRYGSGQPMRVLKCANMGLMTRSL